MENADSVVTGMGTVEDLVPLGVTLGTRVELLLIIDLLLGGPVEDPALVAELVVLVQAPLALINLK
ncbi:hypothetical protein C1H46_044962 [Malus baccata]|uniref:Uncharacterized protein n=1 Tax=Malus baccata TaxID=106549 RepID=A0A540K5K5_MALBA|nr:hypothetical protein C1H46_044962 [Malus baccata]